MTYIGKCTMQTDISRSLKNILFKMERHIFIENKTYFTA